MRFILGALALTLWAAPAWAADEELIFALEPQYALLTDDGGQRHGGGGEGAIWVGINDFLWLVGSGGLSYVGASDDFESQLAWNAHGGVVASLDVLRAIPFVEAVIGVVGNGRQLDPSFRLGLGLDYLITSSWSVGAVIRFRPLTGALGDNILNVAVRLGYRLELW